jgi:hypothetical protein
MLVIQDAADSQTRWWSEIRDHVAEHIADTGSE